MARPTSRACQSAGTDPKVGLDGRVLDVIVTFDGAPAVPVPAGTRHVVWEVPDPRGRSLDEVARIRDDLIARIDALADSLGVPAAA